MTGLDSMSGIVEMLRCGSAWESDLVGPNMSGGPHGLGHISALLLGKTRGIYSRMCKFYRRFAFKLRGTSALSLIGIQRLRSLEMPGSLDQTGWECRG